MKHKVGDKVRVKSLDWYNTNKNKIGDVPLKSQYFVKNMSKFCGIFVTIKRVAQSYYLIEEDDFGWHFTDEMFEEGIYFSELYCDKTQKIIWTEFAPDTTELVIGENHELIINDEIYKVIKKRSHKEKTMEEIYINKIGFNDDKARLILPNGYEFKAEGNEVFVVKKKPRYPKTYKECCEVIEYKITGDTIIGYNCGVLRGFQQLLICRDAYWKIAGGEIGLNESWKPDWENDSDKYFICYLKNELWMSNIRECNRLLVFPTEEMRDAFYENFKDLIEQCKELL